MKKVFATLCAATMALGMSAAVTPHYGVELGYDHGWAHLRADNWPGYSVYVDEAKMDGFHVGGNVQLDFMEGQHRPSLVLGLNYQFLGNNAYKNIPAITSRVDQLKTDLNQRGATDVKGSCYVSMHTIQIPVRAQYTYMFNNDWRFYCYTGPQVRLHASFLEHLKVIGQWQNGKEGFDWKEDLVAGKSQAIEWNDGDKEEYNEKITKTIGCFDMSWGFGVGFGWKSLSLAFNYDLGMINIFKAKNTDNVRFNSDALAVTLGFRIK